MQSLPRYTPQWTKDGYVNTGGTYQGLTSLADQRVRRKLCNPPLNNSPFNYPPSPPTHSVWPSLNVWSTNDNDMDIFQKFGSLDFSDLSHIQPTSQRCSPINRPSSPLTRSNTPPNTKGDVFRPSPGDPLLRQKRSSISSTGSSTGSEGKRAFTIIVDGCCERNDFKVTCKCCGDEVPTSHALQQPQDNDNARRLFRPRVIPVATSQLGFCRFCQVNGEPPEVVRSHGLRSDDGKVTCPTLREYNCPICNNGGGDFAHTIKYCPLARRRPSPNGPLA